MELIVVVAFLSIPQIVSVLCWYILLFKVFIDVNCCYLAGTAWGTRPVQGIAECCWAGLQPAGAAWQADQKL